MFSNPEFFLELAMARARGFRRGPFHIIPFRVLLPDQQFLILDFPSVIDFASLANEVVS